MRSCGKIFGESSHLVLKKEVILDPMTFRSLPKKNAGHGNFFKKLPTAYGFLVLSYMIFPCKGYAYLDPGTGSYFLQLLIASVLGGLYAIKVFWKNIKTFFKNIFSKEKKA